MSGMYCILVYNDMFDLLNCAGMIQLISEDIQDFYELVNVEQYSENFGLDYSIDNDIAIFL